MKEDIEKQIKETKRKIDEAKNSQKELKELEAQLEKQLKEESKKVFEFGVPKTAEDIKELFSLGEEEILLPEGYSYISRTEFAIEEYDLEYPNFTIKHLESGGGYEGGGEEFWVVFGIKKDGEILSYWKWDGWYQSYAGCELTSLNEVTPRERTVTVYE